MTFSIGRAGTDVVLDNPGGVTTQGNRVIFTQNAQTCANLTDMRALQQQLAGMADNPDEPVVPVIWSDNAYFTGFYRVSGVDVGSYPSGYASFAFPWRVELVPMWRYSAGSFEQMATIGTRRGASAALAVAGLPVGAIGVAVRSGTFTSGGAAYTTRTGADGIVPVLGSAAAQRTLVGYGSTPANHYLGSCYLKVGANTRYAVGQQVEDETSWEIGNSLVKVSGSSANSQINVQHYAGAYRSKPYKLQVNGADLPAATSRAVLRNSPECVIYRTYHTISGGSPNQVAVTYVLRRGSIVLECTISSAAITGYGVTAMKIVCATTEAGTSGTSSGLTYVQATGADGAGDKYTLMAGTQPAGSGALTADTANGGLNLANPVSYFAFGVTANMGGSAGSATVIGEGIISLTAQYGAAVNQLQVPVS